MTPVPYLSCPCFRTLDKRIRFTSFLLHCPHSSVAVWHGLTIPIPESSSPIHFLKNLDSAFCAFPQLWEIRLGSYLWTLSVHTTIYMWLRTSTIPDVRCKKTNKCEKHTISRPLASCVTKKILFIGGTRTQRLVWIQSISWYWQHRATLAVASLLSEVPSERRHGRTFYEGRYMCHLVTLARPHVSTWFRMKIILTRLKHAVQALPEFKVTGCRESRFKWAKMATLLLHSQQLNTSLMLPPVLASSYFMIP